MDAAVDKDASGQWGESYEETYRTVTPVDTASWRLKQMLTIRILLVNTGSFNSMNSTQRAGFDHLLDCPVRVVI